MPYTKQKWGLNSKLLTMFYIKKCKEKGCKRYGTVALKVNSEYCNLHSQEAKTVTVELEVNNTELRDENGARIED